MPTHEYSDDDFDFMVAALTGLEAYLVERKISCNLFAVRSRFDQPVLLVKITSPAKIRRLKVIHIRIICDILKARFVVTTDQTTDQTFTQCKSFEISDPSCLQNVYEHIIIEELWEIANNYTRD